MSLISISTIRNHLYRLNPGDEAIRNHAVRISSDASAQLPHTHILQSSERVKAVQNSIPVSEMVTIGTASIPLSHAEIAGDSFVCAKDSSLSVVYQENSDYFVDYTAGALRRIEGGAIVEGQTVRVWYVRFDVYSRNIDYYFDYEKGQIRRIASGAIEDGQEIMVDYQMGASEFSEAEIEQCIIEAESELFRLIDTKYRDSTDPALQTAAACLTMSYICRNTAGVAQSSANSSGKANHPWLEIAASYRDTALRLIVWYRPEIPPLHSPKLF